MQLDLKYWFGLGVALVSLAPFLSESVKILISLVGIAFVVVSLIVWLYRVLTRTSSWPTDAVASPQKPLRIPLKDAASTAYERTRHSLMGRTAEAEGEADKIVTWYCYLLWGRGLAIYGTRPPSTKIEMISSSSYKNTHSFEVTHGAVILSERSGRGRFENLQVAADDLTRVLDEIAEEYPMQEGRQ
jgi:hypothetical protein